MKMPIVVGSHLGGADLSVGAGAWTNFRSSNMQDARQALGTMLLDAFFWSQVTVLNTHDTQTIYIALLDLSGEDPPVVTNRIPVPPRQSVTIDTYKMNVQDVSLIGSDAATTGFVTGYFFRLEVDY